MHGRAAALLIVTLVLGAPVALPAGASAEVAPLPGDAATGTGRNDLLYQVSCPAAGDCVGVGAYSDQSANNQALIESESDGTWVPSAIPDASLPNADPATTPPQPYLTGVACASVGSCVAVDAYDDSSAHEQGLLDVESNGSWTPDEAPLPGDAASNPGVEVYDVTCPVAGACIGVGSYVGTDTYPHALIETQTLGGWSPTEPVAPPDSSTASFYPSFDDVSCGAEGDCAAVGDYTDVAGNQQGLLESDSGGTWTGTELDLPADLDPATNPLVIIGDVSCAAAGTCAAVGIYEKASGAVAALSVNEVAGTWQPATALTLPGNASTTADASGDPIQNDLYLNGLSCSSVGNCTAVGSYDATSANDVEPFALSETAGAWGTGTEVSPPDGSNGPSAITNPQASLDSVTCQSAGNCLAVGVYVDAGGDDAALVARQSDGIWSTAGADLAAPYVASLGDEFWASVACAHGGYCATDGYVADAYASDGTTPVNAAFILNAPAAVATPTVIRTAGTQATVSWRPPSDDGGLPISGYTVTANDLTASARGGQSVQAGASDTAATIPDLAAGDSYTFTVTAQSLLGSGMPATSTEVGSPTSTPPTSPTPPPTSAPPTSPPTSVLATTPNTSTTPSTTMPSSIVTQAPSRARIYRSLEVLLAPTGSRARRPRVIRAHGFVFTYKALEAGRVSVRWYQPAAHDRHQRRKLVGSGSITATRAGEVQLVVRLTPLGRRLLAGAHRLQLTAVVSFRGGGLSVSRTHGFTLG